MKRKLIFTFFSVILLISCAKSNQPIVKRDHMEEMNVHEPALIEEEIQNEVEKQIVFSLPNEKITIDLMKVPILKEYLQWVEEPDEAVKMMEIIPLKTTDITVYLLEFSCNYKYCSYLLFSESKRPDNQKSLLVGDLVKFAQSFYSPDQKKLLLEFHRIDNHSIPLANIVIVDLEEFELLSFTSNPYKKEELFPYQWPIIDVIWKDNDSITIYIPDLAFMTPELYNKWLEKKQETKEITLTLEK